LPHPPQSELVEQLPHLPLLHLPNLQSELVLQLPHWPLLHLLLGQSELVEQRLAASKVRAGAAVSVAGASIFGVFGLAKFADDRVAKKSPATSMQPTLIIVTIRFMVRSSHSDCRKIEHTIILGACKPGENHTGD